MITGLVENGGGSWGGNRVFAGHGRGVERAGLDRSGVARVVSVFDQRRA